MTRTRLLLGTAVLGVAGLCAACGSSTPHAKGSTPVTTLAPTTATAGGSTTVTPATTSVTTAPASSSAPSTTSAGQAPAGPSKACTVVTVPEAQALLGGTVTALPGSTHGVSSECLFKSDGGKTLDVQVGSTVANEASSVSPDKFAAEMTKYSGTAFSGAGDAAYVAKANSFEAFLKGDLEVVLVYSTSLISADDVTSFEQLAKDAAGRV